MLYYYYINVRREVEDRISDDNVVNLGFDKLPGGQQAIGGLVLGNLTCEDWHNLFSLGERLEFMQGDAILE